MPLELSWLFVGGAGPAGAPLTWMEPFSAYLSHGKVVDEVVCGHEDRGEGWRALGGTKFKRRLHIAYEVCTRVLTGTTASGELACLGLKMLNCVISPSARP